MILWLAQFIALLCVDAVITQGRVAIAGFVATFRPRASCSSAKRPSEFVLCGDMDTAMDSVLGFEDDVGLRTKKKNATVLPLARQCHVIFQQQESALHRRLPLPAPDCEGALAHPVCGASLCPEHAALAFVLEDEALASVSPRALFGGESSGLRLLLGVCSGVVSPEGPKVLGPLEGEGQESSMKN